MHEIEPYIGWRDNYIAAEDRQSPFYGRVYDEFKFTQKIYNYFIHPQWDDFGSDTLYTKILFVDYQEGFAFLEFIGEWNDCLHNDIMFLKRDIIDKLIDQGIYRYVLLCDNVLNFHSGDDSYYEEWYEEVVEEDGWICFINLSEHVKQEMELARIQYYTRFGPEFNDFIWRKKKPTAIIQSIDNIDSNSQKQLL